MSRALAVVNRHSTEERAAFRAFSHASIFGRTRSLPGSRWFRHWRDSLEHSLSAIFSQLPCFGVE